MNILSENLFIQDLIAKWEQELEFLGDSSHPNYNGLKGALNDLQKKLEDEKKYCELFSIDCSETMDIDPAYLHA